MRLAYQSRDDLLQGFQGVLYRIQAARDLLHRDRESALTVLDEALDAGDDLIREGRNSVPGLNTATLCERDFGETLIHLSTELLSAGEGPPITLSVIVEGRSRSLKETLRDDVYRIARQALQNALHHAQSSLVESEINYGRRRFTLRVRDNGIGIAATGLTKERRCEHWGLAGMRERAHAVGGTLSVWSEPGAGTEIDLNIPAAMAFECGGRGLP
jgi:signal transduction histidine kinase